MKRRVGILLCGCGAVDGSDPFETVLLTLAVQKAGHEPIFLALDLPQFHVADHTTTEECPSESRNQFTESARLVRGKLYPLQEISPKMLDILIIVGGQGAAKNLLLGFGSSQPRLPHPEVQKYVTELRASGGVVGALSLAEFVLSAICGAWPDNQGCLELPPDGVLVDRSRGLALAPGSLLATDHVILARGIEALVQALLELCELRN